MFALPSQGAYTSACSHAGHCQDGCLLHEHAGYQFNVTFLRLFLAPIFEVHEIKQAGPREMVIKWSWTMNFWWLRYTPFKVVWDPRLTFTGITILGYSESGAALQASNTSKAACAFHWKFCFGCRDLDAHASVAGRL